MLIWVSGPPATSPPPSQPVHMLELLELLYAKYTKLASYGSYLQCPYGSYLQCPHAWPSDHRKGHTVAILGLSCKSLELETRPIRLIRPYALPSEQLNCHKRHDVFTCPSPSFIQIVGDFTHSIRMLITMMLCNHLKHSSSTFAKAVS